MQAPTFGTVAEAAQMQLEDVAMDMVRQGRDIDGQDVEGCTALHWAANIGNAGFCRKLLSAGARGDIANGRDETPSHLAAKCGNLEVVRLIHKKFPEAVLFSRDADGFTPFIVACQNNNAPMLEWLFFQGVNVDERDFQGRTALMWAAYRGHRRSVQWLLSRRASAALADDDGMTALHWAAVRGHTAIVQMLLDIGMATFLTTPDNSGDTPLVLAWRKSFHSLFFSMLKSAFMYRLFKLHRLTKNMLTCIFGLVSLYNVLLFAFAIAPDVAAEWPMLTLGWPILMSIVVIMWVSAVVGNPGWTTPRAVAHQAADIQQQEHLGLLKLWALRWQDQISWADRINDFLDQASVDEDMEVDELVMEAWDTEASRHLLIADSGGGGLTSSCGGFGRQPYEWPPSHRFSQQRLCRLKGGDEAPQVCSNTGSQVLVEGPNGTPFKGGSRSPTSSPSTDIDAARLEPPAREATRRNSNFGPASTRLQRLEALQRLLGCQQQIIEMARRSLEETPITGRSSFSTTLHPGKSELQPLIMGGADEAFELDHQTSDSAQRGRSIPLERFKLAPLSHFGGMSPTSESPVFWKDKEVPMLSEKPMTVSPGGSIAHTVLGRASAGLPAYARRLGEATRQERLLESKRLAGPDYATQVLDGDFRHACIICHLNRGFRCFHCKECGRCVQRLDHHCPWIDNCVGLRNQRLFFTFLWVLFACLSTILFLGSLALTEMLHPKKPLTWGELLVGTLELASLGFDAVWAIFVFSLIFRQTAYMVVNLTTYEVLLLPPHVQHRFPRRAGRFWYLAHVTLESVCRGCRGFWTKDTDMDVDDFGEEDVGASAVDIEAQKEQISVWEPPRSGCCALFGTVDCIEACGEDPRMQRGPHSSYVAGTLESVSLPNCPSSSRESASRALGRYSQVV